MNDTTHTPTTKPQARIFDLGLSDYEKARQLQLQMVDRVIAGEAPDTFIFTSHPPTITVGRGSDVANILASDEELQKRGVAKYEVERGGDVTFHGPGQQIVYPIVNLEQRGRDLHKFLRDLEEVVILFLKEYSIEGERIAGKTGVWVGGKKICAIGIAVKRWVSYHGLALNLDTDLSYFQLINPCGFAPDSVTSLTEVAGSAVDRSRVFYQLSNSIEKVFGVTLVL
ncbi:MAG: lipoyl(octanoyl) transferase LipB [candidate division Zixibacteria bacterium]|nr:lipoyl(octanoyl) transferase LipB [candidate division Zixibacteria bacterium]